MPTKSPVRRATIADLPEVLRVVNLAYQVEAFFIAGDRITPTELRERFERPGAEFLVIDGAASGPLVAAVHFEPRGEHGWFGLLAVDPAAQGAGHARLLIAAMEERCRALHLPALQLEVVDLRTELPPFYAKFGFVDVERKPFPDTGKLTIPAEMVVMRKGMEGSES